MNDDHLVYFECLPLFVGEILLARAKQRKSVDLLRSGQQHRAGNKGFRLFHNRGEGTYYLLLALLHLRSKDHNQQAVLRILC